MQDDFLSAPYLSKALGSVTGAASGVADAVGISDDEDVVNKHRGHIAASRANAKKSSSARGKHLLQGAGAPVPAELIRHAPWKEQLNYYITRLVLSDRFDAICGMVVVCNAVVMGVE